MFNKKAADDYEKKITDQIAAGGSGNLSNPASKRRKDRNACDSDQDIEDTAYGAVFHSKHIAGQIESKGGER